jgi:hypothetical protein
MSYHGHSHTTIPKREADAMLEPPAMLAILGATPLGVEAALYGRFLGYKAALLDEGTALAELRQRGAEPLGGPFREHSSPLGLAALAAQNPDDAAPDPAAMLSAQRWVEAYLAPLLASDLLAESLREQTQIVSVERVEPEWDESDAEADEGEEPMPQLLLTLRDRSGQESSIQVAMLIDALPSAPALSTEHLWPTPLARDAAGAPRPFAAGLKEIVALFAELRGRPDLDLYRRFERP